MKQQPELTPEEKEKARAALRAIIEDLERRGKKYDKVKDGRAEEAQG